jgi:hypothetical protein
LTSGIVVAGAGGADPVVVTDFCSVVSVDVVLSDPEEVSDADDAAAGAEVSGPVAAVDSDVVAAGGSGSTLMTDPDEVDAGGCGFEVASCCGE